VGQGFEILRANVAYGGASGLSLRAVPGRRCHEVLFGRDAPCDGCPVAGGVGPVRRGRVAGWTLEARLLGVRGVDAWLCRYEPAGGEP
jgi:hypothetical protein